MTDEQCSRIVMSLDLIFYALCAMMGISIGAIGSILKSGVCA